MGKQKLYDYDSYSSKDQDKLNKDWIDKFFPRPSISVKDNLKDPPKSAGGKRDREKPLFSAARLKKS